MNSKTAIIGHTGFVGGNLTRQTQFDDYYNSKTIEQIKGLEYDLLICSGARAEKWKANHEPSKDIANIEYLISCLQTVKVRHIILISTVDVYPTPIDVNEETAIIKSGVSAYGLHRLRLEEFVQEDFPSLTIIRLPGLFGPGLKKNFIYDLLNNNVLHLTDANSRFQFYGLEYLWVDIQRTLANNIELINFATPPLSAHAVAERCFGIEFSNRTPNGPVFYDMQTNYAHCFSETGKYIWNMERELFEIEKFIIHEKKGAGL